MSEQIEASMSALASALEVARGQVNTDPLALLGQIRRIEQSADAVRSAVVTDLRDQDVPWSVIAEAIGTSFRAVVRHYGRAYVE